MSFILGISGLASSGKDSIADYLHNHHGFDGKLSFAEELKEICRMAFGLSSYEVSSQEGKRDSFPKPLLLTEDRLLKIENWVAKTHSVKRTPAVESFLGKEFSNARQILQIVGTDIIRSYAPNYHIDMVEHRINLGYAGNNYVIPDVRFPNEAEFILSKGGLVIKVVRDKSNLTASDYSHQSENSLESWDKFAAVINNSEIGLHNLYLKVDAFLTEHNLGRKNVG